ncbi:unnamed protein product [Diamesa serratosioi]
MGCAQSAEGNNKQNGENLVGPNEPPAPAPPDPRLPLTARQKYSMVASWKGISRAMETTGINMFIKLFEEHLDLIEMFSKFKELKTKEQQATSEELAEHANKVMETLDEGIRSLDDLDVFFEFLYEIGASHTRIPGFTAAHFWKIEKPFLNAVSATLGDRYTENVEGIYNITIKFIIETLVEGFSNSQNGHYVANSSKNSIKNTTISNNSDGANKTNSLSGDTQTKCSRPKPSS